MSATRTTEVNVAVAAGIGAVLVGAVVVDEVTGELAERGVEQGDRRRA